MPDKNIMNKIAESSQWLKRAKSNLCFAKLIDEYEIFGGEIFFEEPCFQFQQSVEKALKALLIFNNVEYQKTLDISELLKLLEKNGFNLPENILNSAILTKYAIETRYPDNTRIIAKEEYSEALKIAEDVYNWVYLQINKV